MGTDRSGDSLRGILVPDSRRVFWDTMSGEYSGGAKVSKLNSMSPIAGIPEPSQSGAMGLRASGAQEQALYTLTNRGGLPGTDECGMLWSDIDGSAYRGCDLPNVSAAFEPLPQAGKVLRKPHIKALSNGKLIKAYWSDGVGVEVRVRDPDTTVWGAAVSVHTETTTNPCPALQVQPDGRIHLYAFEELDASTLQIILYYSDDDGATWENAGYVLADSIDLTTYTAYYRIRTGYNNGQVVMFLHLFLSGGTREDVLSQWASSDGGHYFSEVYTQDGSDEDNAGASPEIVIDQGVILIGYIRTTLDTTDHVHAEFRRLGTAWYRFDYAPVLGTTFDKDAARFWGDLPAALIVDPFFAFWADDDGSLYCTGVDYSTGAAAIMRSADHAETWIGTGTTARFTSLGQCWWDHDSTDDIAMDFSAVAWRGKSAIATGWTRVGTQEDAIGVIYLGGWQTETMGNRTSIQRPTHRRGWERPGYSTSLPDETGVWALAGLGAVAINADNHLQMTPAGVQTVLYSCVPTASILQGLNHEWAVMRAAGVGTYPRMQLEIDDGVNGYGIYVLLTDTTAQLWDLHGAMIDEVTLPDSDTGFYRIRMAIQSNNCRARIAPHDTSPDTVWTTIGSSSALTDSGGAAGANLIEWGLDAAGDATWIEWHYADDSYTSAATWAAGQAVRSRYPRPVLGSPVWFGLGVSLSADTGPTIVGDEWTVSPTAEYPVDNLDPTIEPSPRHPWRSREYADMVATSVDEIRIAWELGDVDEYAMSNLWALWIDDANCAGIGIYLYYGAAWHLVKTTGYDTFSGTKAGSTLRVDIGGSQSGANKWRRGELDGAGIESVTLVGNSSDWVGKIINNRQGSTFIDIPNKTMRFAATIEGTSVLLVASPVVRLWPKRHLILINLDDYDDEIMGVQIRITKQPLLLATSPGNPYDGYFELGKVVFGPVWAWGRDYSWGRSITHEVSQDIVTAEDGTRIVRSLAPVRRIVEMSWADEVAECQYIEDDLPDYVSFKDTTPAVAFYQDTPLDVVDEVRQLQGAHTPVVYLPIIPRDSTGDYDQWGQGAVYGRITESSSIDTVQGQEGVDELNRLSKLIIEEEI